MNPRAIIPMKRPAQFHKRALGGALLAAGLCAAFALQGHALAGMTTCRTDPVVTLSNGAQITMWETITDTATDVSSITYQLHIPVGLTVSSIAYSGAVPANLQTITTSADENPGNYDAYTVVYTKTPNIAVTAYMSAMASGMNTVSSQTAGHSAQSLHNHLHLA